MPGAVMFGRHVEFSPQAWNNAFIDGARVFTEICTNQFPVIKQSRSEVESTTSCSTGKEYVPGMQEGSEFMLSGVFEGSNSGAYGIGGTSLAALAAAPAGSIVAFKDYTTQWGANDIFHRFDVALLDVEFSGGGLDDLQAWNIRGRITGGVNRASA